MTTPIVIVTGSGGLIGSAYVRHFATQGFDVLTIERLAESRPKAGAAPRECERQRVRLLMTASRARTNPGRFSRLMAARSLLLYPGLTTSSL